MQTWEASLTVLAPILIISLQAADFGPVEVVHRLRELARPDNDDAACLID